MATAQRRFLLSHSFVRLILSRYFPTLSESEWEFEFGPHGRPELARELVQQHRELKGLRFSLSHTDSLYALLVARDIDCGVDVETTTRSTDLVGVGKRSFAPSEFTSFQQLSGDSQRQRFFEYWTLKESYIKAIGTGLATPLRNFWFDLGDSAKLGIEADHLANGDMISVAFAPVHDDDPDRWTFGLQRPTPEHQLAWAIATPVLAPLEHAGTCPAGVGRPVLVKWLT